MCWRTWGMARHSTRRGSQSATPAACSLAYAWVVIAKQPSP
jgi:hypothetical protein